ncbi:MAG: WD40 repeat domain-containing protein [Actinomycetota bacterium]
MSSWDLRKSAQVTLAVIAALAAITAGFRYFTRGGSFFGPHIEATPTEGPVGIKPFFEFRGFDGGREIKVFLCRSGTGDVADCADLGTGRAGERLSSKPVPKTFPDNSEVEAGRYALRAGPNENGAYDQYGSFEIVPFKVGPRPDVVSYAGLQASDLRLGPLEQVATGAPCRTPLFLPDDRFSVGSNVIDPTNGVTIAFEAEGHELAWSPVGDKLAVLTSDRKEIRLAAPDGSGAVTTVREARGLLSSLSWSPEGDKLAYIAQRDPSTSQLAGDPGPPTVMILNSINGNKTSAGPGLGVAWSPSSDLLAVEMSGSRIEASDLAGKRRHLTTGVRPGWSPDGRFVTVVRGTPAGGREGWVVPVEGDGGVPLAGAEVCALHFSSSGRSLAVVKLEEGKMTTYLRSVETPNSAA